MAETGFSSFKRMFCEDVTPKSEIGAEGFFPVLIGRANSRG